MISVNQLTKTFGPMVAVNSVSFEVHPGEAVGLLGPNGAGKSTTMKILTGLLPASKGEVKVLGQSLAESRLDVVRHIGYLPEELPLYKDMSVYKYLQFVAAIKKVPHWQKAIDDVLSVTQLKGREGSRVGQLSRGLKQRLGLAQALIHDPKVLILDEPTLGLDPRQVAEMRSIILRLKKDRTVLISSHVLHEVEQMCDRVVVMNQGQVVATEVVSELSQKYSQMQVVVEFLEPSFTDQVNEVIKPMGLLSEQQDERQVLISGPIGPEVCAELSKRLTHNIGGVVAFTPRRLKLEDLFLQVTENGQ